MNSPHLMMLLAQAREADLRRAADAHNRHRRPSQTPRPFKNGLSLRTGFRAAEDPLARPAGRDGSEPRAQPILLAEVDGQLCAALSLPDGTVVVDPFHLRAGLIDLLRERARQLEGPGAKRRQRRFRRRPTRSSP